MALASEPHNLRKSAGGRARRDTTSPADSLSQLAESSPDSEAEDLKRRLTYLMAFRVLLITMVMGATTILFWLSDADLTLPSSLILYGVIAITYLLTLFYARQLEHSNDLRSLAVWQVVGDLVIATVIVHVTGGVQSAYTFFYPLAIIASAVVRYRRGAFWVTGAAVLLFLSVSYFGWTEIIPTPAGAVAPPDELMPLAFGRALGLNLAAILGVGAMAAQLAAQLQKTSHDLEVHKSVAADLLTLHEDIVRGLTSGLVTVDTNGVLLTMNAAACKILETTPEQAIGTPLAECSESIAKALSSSPAKTSTSRDEVQHLVSKGYITLGISLSPLLDHTAKTVGRIINFQDLTDVRLLEEKVKRDEHLTAIGTMAAGIAHEIRNPLASISGSIELMSSDPARDEESAALMNIVIREIERLNSLISVLLDYANPRPPNIIDFDICEVIRDTFRVFAQNSDFADVNVVFVDDYQERVIRLRADPEKIRQLIWNLLCNCTEAARTGGKNSSVSVTSSENFIDLAFFDDGPGIEVDQLAKVFDPFFTTKAKGSGLGLAVVQSIVLDHHGSVWVESEPGQGASFFVRLPYASGHDS